MTTRATRRAALGAAVLLALAVRAPGAAPPEDRAAPPAWLDAVARGVLDAVADGRDGPDEGLAVLVAAVADRAAPEVAATLDPIALRDAPAAWRGAALRFVGVVQQVRALDPPWAEVHECFVRADDGQPFVVFVRADGSPPPALAPGRRVAGTAIAYKRIDAVARDGAAHRYPSLVAGAAWIAATGGAAPWQAPPRTAPLALLAVLVPALVVAHRMARRARRAPRRASAPGAEPAAGHAASAVDLPDDPAAALDELRRRA